MFLRYAIRKYANLPRILNVDFHPRHPRIRSRCFLQSRPAASRDDNAVAQRVKSLCQPAPNAGTAARLIRDCIGNRSPEAITKRLGMM